MNIELLQEEEYRGTKHPKGACIEVGDHLGGQMLLNSLAKQTTREEVAKYEESVKTRRDEKAKQLDAMRLNFEALKEKERIKLGEQHEIEGFKDLSEEDQIQKLVEVAMSLGDEL